MDSKFNFYEYVKIVSKKPEHKEIEGLIGAISGKAKEDDGSWHYSVFIPEKKECWSVEESDLESTGEFGKRSDFYPE